MLMKAYLLRKVDRDEEIYLQAWANREIKARRSGKSARPVYDDFKKFFDKAKRENEIIGNRSVSDTGKSIIKALNKMEGKHGDL